MCAPDDWWKYHAKHVEQFPEINKLCNVASCWIFTKRNIQGGSNMTGTDLSVNKCKQSRSYLNHPVPTMHGPLNVNLNLVVN